jgi:O-Antigen ligase
MAMTESALIGGDLARRSALLAFRPSTIRRWVLWAFVACGCVASIEPSPYEFMFFVCLIAHGFGQMRFDKAMVPLIVGLAVFNAGGLVALPPFVGERESVLFVATSIYIALTAVVFAAIVAKDPESRMATIRSGYAAAGLIAATLGVLGYFDVAGLGPLFTAYDSTRASGPFKDPNVFGPFLIPALVFPVQDLMLRRGVGWLRGAIQIAVVSLAVLLSFSRGAWVDFVATTAMLLVLTFLTSGSARLRRRVIVLSAGAAALVAVVLVVALAAPEIRETMNERFSLVQDYDVGETGRFGNQLRSIPLLLERPFGFGPLRFDTVFIEAPHQVYLNAFASYGWLGGLAFLSFTAATLYLGWTLVFRRSPLQRHVVAVWSCLFPQMAQGIQIDSDHWRHLFLLFGCLYGLAGATAAPQSVSARGRSPPVHSAGSAGRERRA